MEWHPIDWIGLVGGILLLVGFWRTSIGQWKTTSFWYELDNLLGCALLLLYAWQKHAYVNIVLNVIWGIVAFRGLTSYTERKKSRRRNKKRPARSY